MFRAAQRPAAPRRPAATGAGVGRPVVGAHSSRPWLGAAPAWPWQPQLWAAPGAEPDGDPATWPWVNISQWVRNGSAVTVTAGRSPTASAAEPLKMTATLDNRDGRWTPSNARSPWYPMIRTNMPMQLVVGPYSRGVALVDAGGWEASWDGMDATVAVSASGRLRKESQKARPERSALTRTIRAELPPGCRGWWPCEEQADAQLATSPVPGVLPATAEGNVHFAGFGADKSEGGTQIFGFSAMPDLSAGGLLRGRPLPGGSPSAWTVTFFGGGEWIQYTGTTFTPVDTPLMDWDTPGGTYTWWRVILTTTNRVELRAYNAVGYTLAAYISGTGGPVWQYQVEAKQVGGSIAVLLRAGGDDATGSIAGTLAPVTEWRANPDKVIRTDPGLGTGGKHQIGQVLVCDGTNVPMWYRRSPDPSWSAYMSEQASIRVARLCQEEGVPALVRVGQSNTAMAAQKPGRLLDLLREVEQADLGILHDAGPSGALVYVARSALYNSPVAMTVLAGGVTGQQAPGLVINHPEDEVVNDITVKRDGAGSAREVDEASVAEVGRTEQSETIAVYQDRQLQDQARWRLHLAERARVQWGELSCDLRGQPELVGPWLACGIAGRVLVPNLHEQPTAPTIDCDMIVGKYTEKISMLSWSVSMECAPWDAYRCFEVGSRSYGRLDTEHSVLQSDVSDSQASFVVESGVCPWVSTAANPEEFPFDVEIGGEKMTVTGIVGESLVQTFQVVRAVNSVSRPHDAGDAVRLWDRAVLAL